LLDRSEVETNNTIIKTWLLENNGSIAWPEGTQLIYVRGDDELLVQEQYSVPLAKPKERVEVSAVLNIPSKPGRYNVYFKLADAARNVFGPRIWADLLAVAPEISVATQAEVTIPITTPEAPQQNVVPSQEVSVELPVETAEQQVVEPVVTDDSKQSELEESLAAEAAQQQSVADAPKRWDVVVHSEDSDSDNDSENEFVKIDSTPTTSGADASSSTSNGRATSFATSDVAASSSTSSDNFERQLITLNELGFNNNVLNLFLLKQHNGDLQKTITWLVDKLQ